MTYDLMQKQAEIRAAAHRIDYHYKGIHYGLVTNGTAVLEDNLLTIRGEQICLRPCRRAEDADRKGDL